MRVAWRHRDEECFQKFLSDDHVEVGTKGLDELYARPFHAARFDDNTALPTYRAEQDTMCGQSAVPSPAWVSSLIVRRNGKSVNALDQHARTE